ncbi:HNH endonuclease [Candidatus Pollutiaquabacter sp.]|uniref:HNH endonuclease n=1 Tax=Candidatus Pollutiaquabacter sp. TaxID=3416354 RepID=UPI003CBB7B84|nr:HNH endonuclease [Bacteroidota bacterium]
MNPLPFIPKQLYNRRTDIHAKYGGNWQSGICPSANYPYIFIFSGKSGRQHGYKDGWDNPDVYSYTGEGQAGDMQFTKGNLALRDHIQNGKRVFLFEIESKGIVRFICEVEVFDTGYFETHDTAGKQRIGITFFFKRLGVFLPALPGLFDSLNVAGEPPVEYSFKLPNETERKGLITSRVGQGAYRKRIIHRWEYKCAVTGFNKLDVLIASHIVPWKDSTENERLDVHNGILLSPTFDALFDRHLISFSNNGKIILTDKIELQAFNKVGVWGKEVIKNLSIHNHEYLEKHRNLFHQVNSK